MYISAMSAMLYTYWGRLRRTNRRPAKGLVPRVHIPSANRKEGQMSDLSQLLGADLGSSVTSTLQHIELLREKAEKLQSARHEAEEQFLARIGSAYRCGDINAHQLMAVFERYKAMGLTGRLTRWDAHISITWKQMCHLRQQLSNGPEGSWVGEYPILIGQTAPTSGVAVVYVLFDAANEPCYVGSTSNFRVRLSKHRKDGKGFVRWQAHPCRDREHAYLLEDRLLKEHLPRLNRKASR
jgi:hypothetical protein